MKYYLSLILIIIGSFCLTAQDGGDQQLAQHYYSQGDYEKALIYYEHLFEENKSKFIFNRYYDCLQRTGDTKTAEKVLKKQAKDNKGDLEYQIMLAKLYEEQGNDDKADNIYESLIDDLTSNARNVISLYNSFKAQGKNDWSFKVLERGRKLLKKNYPLNFQFAEYYGSIGNIEKMMAEYLDLLDYHPTYMNSLQKMLVRQISFEDEDSKEYEILKVALIQRTQKNANNLIYAEMLTWLFVQRQNFVAALTHVKALDKRSNFNGKLVYDLGVVCRENKDYSTAKKAFQYVIELGSFSYYYLRSHNALLNVRFIEVTTLRDYSQTELQNTITAYENALIEFGEKPTTLNILLELAHIEAFYANRGPDAIDRLEKAKEIQGLTDMQLAKLKMQLADVHVLHGDIWEASLLYMQIDKSFKYEHIGHEAKFKNARIFYYDGEFNFAQSQLDVLKQSTSQLIANDALKLSLLITDNFGLDSNYQAMQWFATADLLISQHKFDQAYVLFDSIITTYPAHSLGDDILIKKSAALKIKGQWAQSIETLEELLKYYSNDILVDDALFELGNIYENHLLNKEKAAEYYRQILFDHKGSLYTAEARKRFQEIRKTLPAEELENGLN